MDVFLEACHRVQEALPQARWLCVGDGPERAALERRAAGYSPPLQIVWAGWREDVPRLLAALDVFVLASRAEAFPLVVLEAMAAARPVVATDVGGVREAVVHGETGLLVPPEDPEALADAVLDLLGDVNKRRALGQAGRAWVKREFTLERQAREFLKVLFDSPFS
jgi:glycosyltransferase involved in cell wall biosynthesis